MPDGEATTSWTVRARIAIGSVFAVGAVVVAALALHAANDDSHGDPPPQPDRADMWAAVSTGLSLTSP